MWFKHGLKIHDNIKGNIKMRVCHEPMTHPQHIFLILLKSLEILYFTKIL